MIKSEVKHRKRHTHNQQYIGTLSMSKSRIEYDLAMQTEIKPEQQQEYYLQDFTSPF